MAISRPPLTAHASASERMVLVNGPVMMLPALRSQMNSSAGNASAFGKKRVQARVNARQRDDRQRVREIRRMQTGTRVTGHRPVIRVNDGFKKAHKSPRG